MSRASAGELCDSAVLFAVGALDPAEQREFERHLNTCEVCAEEVPDYRESAALLAVTAAIEPPPDLRDRLLNRLAAAVSPAALVRGNEGKWVRTPFTGVEVKQLFADPLTGNVTSLVRVQPGAVYPSHFHAGLEHCYVLEGDLVFEDHVLLAGDYEVAAVKSVHSTVTSKTGCVVLLINNVADELRP